jgi:hypothetical protein
VIPSTRDTSQEFLDWCASAGIQTNLTIQIFEYTNYMKAHMQLAQTEEEDCDEDDDDCVVPAKEFPPLQVRGLAATRDIQEGEVVISIPYSSMIAVPTTIDEDPVLHKVMGPHARQQYEWENDEFVELALLTVAILYHRHLGKASPLYNYIGILESSPTENIPFLWDKDRLKREATPGVRRYARGIFKDVKELYETVIDVLRRDFPELFDTPVYDLSNFLWAFSLVNSRHWLLPVPDFNPDSKHKKKVEEPENQAPSLGIGDQVPPASLPTEEWVQQEQGDSDDDVISHPAERHSFLAPVADLLNFGPPCTRGSYNPQTHAFELVATCCFRKGQEVTYWYSDDCDDIVIANYGFTHPMVRPCPTEQDYQRDLDLWKARSQDLENEIERVYDDLDMVERELQQAEALLNKCKCDDGFMASKSRKSSGSHEHIRGSHRTPSDHESDHERDGVRRKAWNHQKSDIGL